MKNIRQLCITPEDVYEGYGQFASNDDASIPSSSVPPPPPPECIILDSTMTSLSFPSRKWDPADAFRQLREALSIDAPPRLVSRIPLSARTPSADIAPSDTQIDPLGPMVSKIQRSMRASYTLRAIHSECAALLTALSIIEQSQPTPFRSPDSYAWLLHNKGVDILQARALKAMKRARVWREVRELLDQDPFKHRFLDGNNAEQVVGDVIKFRASVADAKELTNEFATLVDRLHLIVPIMESAIGRSRAFNELDETTSLEFSSELENLLKAMGSFEDTVKKNHTTLLRNVEAITERVGCLRQQLPASNENTSAH
ncbi:unnamed protein product [Phytomonas sp. Hart1]|nr:unnamed protein product [Phytomonas sp. Hart1]|eukprot:CCW69388.1 unnamed protein product [Phytomonas sp. isolate Hart1]